MKKIVSWGVSICILIGCTILPVNAANLGWKWPVPSSNSLSSCFTDGRNHNAIDIAASKGSTVVSAYAGKVISTNTTCSHNYGKNSSCGCGGGLGNYVYILSSYNGQNYVSRYGHLSTVSVSVGQSVSKGQTIGTVGSTGYSSGFHLDYQIYVPTSGNNMGKSRIIDPLMEEFLEIPAGLNANAATTSCCYDYVHQVLNKASNSPHTCNKGSYVYYWKAHPHPNCYRCSICGEVWADMSSSRYIADCDACNTITVTTKAAVDITDTTAGLPGSYYNPGSKTIREYGAKYGLSKDNLSLNAPLSRNESYVNGGIPAYVVKNLKPETTYYYRSYVVSGGKTYYGEILSFKTKAKANMWTESMSFPSSIQEGSNVRQTGKIKSNNGVKWVFVGIGRNKGAGSKDAIEWVDDAVWKSGGTNSYSINRIASSLDFSKLSPGTYWVTIQCMDNQNNYFHVYDHSFTVSPIAPVYHTVTFDPNGGTILQTSMQFPHGYVLTANSLPVPTAPYDALTFLNWYDSSGKAVKAGSIITADMELFAQWTRKESSEEGTEVHFPKVNRYVQGQFTDIPASQWFTKNVAGAVEFGLMKGNTPSTFNPYGDVTLAETITMAARIHSIYTTGAESFDQSVGDVWYQVYLNYAYQNGIIGYSLYSGNVQEKATRAQYAEIFANALPDEALAAKNSVPDAAIPDVTMQDSYAGAVYKLYRAGILAGGDANGTFSPLTYITRAESATVVARMADSDNRMSFSL